jgi:hypothetical protein
MAGPRVDPINLNDVEEVVAASGSRRRSLRLDPNTGGKTGWSQMPGGWSSPFGKPGFFEMHSNDEEVFVLGGLIHFGDYYTVTAGAYLNHPPYWVHPSEERNEPDTPTTLIARTSHATDFHFEPIPDNWDGQEFFGGPAFEGPRGKGFTEMRWQDVQPGPVIFRGQDTGLQARTLWHNPRDGWTTWICTFPPGWQGSGDPVSLPGGGDELFLLEGDLTTQLDGADYQLTAGSYYCYPDHIPLGRGKASSTQGATAIRWTRLVPDLQIPAPV